MLGGDFLNTLCIDFGSTFVKFFVHNEDDIIYSNRIEFPKPCVNDGVAYIIKREDIDFIIEKILKLTALYNSKNCFISVQMHGYILKHQNNGFGEYVSWKDKNSNLEQDAVKRIDFHKNGTSAKSNLPAIKLLANPNANECEFFTLGSYIAYYLTGNNKTHKTDACASGFFDAATLRSANIINGITLPKVANDVCPVGAYKEMTVYTPIGDHQTSFIGSGARDNSYFLNIGTATQLSVLNASTQEKTCFEQRPYFDDNRLFTISGLTGGEEIFNGYDIKIFVQEIIDAMKKLPKRKQMVIAGGGAQNVFDAIKCELQEYGIECTKIENAAEEGLKIISGLYRTNIGTMLSETPFVNFPVILKNSNIDFLIIDNEHGAFDYNFISNITTVCRLIGMNQIIRLSDNSRKDITKFVDMGVVGFLLPMTNTAEDIKAVVDYAKYSPIGKRGISTNRAHTLYNPPPIEEYMTAANKAVKVYAQIETKQGVQNIESILKVNGVDGVFVGPNDLSCDMGCIGNNEPIKQALKNVSVAAKKHNKTWGIITASKQLINCSLENGVNFICYGSEINMLKDSSKKIRSNIYD